MVIRSTAQDGWTPELNRLQAVVNKLHGDVYGVAGNQSGLLDSVQSLQQTVGGILLTNANAPATPVSNLLFSGEIGHSVNSWFDSAYTTDDKSKEAAWWFSNDGTLSGLLLSDTDARTSSTNKTLKATSHSTYNPAYGRWNSQNGWAEMTGTKTIDQILPSNNIDATTPLARVSLIAAKKSRFVEIPADTLMFAGIYDNTVGQLKFLEGDLGFTAELVGTPVSTIERRFKIFYQSDRGFSLLSPEITIANAPADGAFNATTYIQMGWLQQAGQLQVQIYEYVPSLAQYKLLSEVSSSTSFIYEGDFLRIVTGYPIATDTVRKAVFYTNSGDMTNLATNGVSPTWDTINFPIGVPNNYNKGNTTGRQWLRLGLTVAPNLFVTGMTSDGSTTVTAPEVAFPAEYDALYDAGTLVAEVYDVNNALLATTTVASRTDDTHLVLGASIAAGSDRKLRIVGGGFHGVVIDKVHLGYQQNTSYAANANDVRILQPVAAPANSDQGGVGNGGIGGGIDTCIADDTPIEKANGEWVEIRNSREGELWSSDGIEPNQLVKKRLGFDLVRRVRASNGCTIHATDTESFMNRHGKVLLRDLRVGDLLWTKVNGRFEYSKIVEISSHLGKIQVVTPSLSGNHLFVAGRVTETPWQVFYRKLTGRTLVRGGFVLSNRKPIDYQYQQTNNA